MEESTTMKKTASPKSSPPTSTRSMWKGAISFGLVHIPIGLYAATASSDIDFDWLDKRNMQPVGYKRINKVTGKEVATADIVKGVEFEEGRYVVLSAQEIADAFPKTTQTIEIEAFVDAQDIPFIYLERPYYTAPLHRGEKVYALLREALRKSNKVGVAKVVIQTKQHLAILIPCGRALVLHLLRWGGEIRSFEQLDLPPLDAKAAGIKSTEMSMAMALIKDMSQAWDADRFRNSFSKEIHQLVQAKAHAGDVQSVDKQEAAPAAPANAAVLDLTALLKNSLGKGAGGPSTTAAKEKNTAATVKNAKTTAPRKSKKSTKTPARPPAKRPAAK